MSTAYRILIAESDRAELELNRSAMLQAGYVVTPVINGKHVVQAVIDGQPDLVVLNVRMTGALGLDVCSTLKSTTQCSSIPVIFISDEVDPDTMIRAFAVGASDFVQRPFRPQELLARISVHVRLHRAESELLEKNQQTAALAKRLTEVNAELALLSRQDALTQLLNRRAWQESATIEHERSMRYGHTYGLIMIDVDFFKDFNDVQGHQAGDECLKRVAAQISNACRRLDLAGRYGGEEFVVLAPEIELPQLRVLAERIRKSIWNSAIPHPGAQVGGRLTISAGCALARPDTSLADIINLADRALYAAKHSGRNRVAMHGQSLWVTAGAPAEPHAFQAAALPASGASDRLSVLLAIGDEGRLRSYQQQLSAAGFNVHSVSHGHSVVGRASVHRPDVILLDTRIPRLAWQVCVDQLRSRNTTLDIPVMVMGTADPNAIREYAERGLEGFVTYDVTQDDLVFRIRSLVRMQRSRAELLQNYEHRGEQARVMSALLDFCRHLVTLNDLGEVLDRTMAAAMELSGCRRAFIMLPDADGNLYLGRSMSEERRNSVHGRVVAPAYVRHVFQNRQSIIRPAAHLAEPFADERIGTHLEGHPVFCQILDTPDEAVGVLTLLDRADGGELDARELECIELIAQIAASSIHDLMTREAHKRACDSIVVALAKLAEFRDNDTGRHLERVTHYCVILAEQLRGYEKYAGSITDEFISDLEHAVPLHDIGKVAVPDSILLKPGRLTQPEMEIMQTHAQTGADTIRFVCQSVPQATFLVMAEAIARAHHERFDGQGYPNRLRGEDIPLAARITALADVYDALTTKRVYKEAMDHEEAVQVISAGSCTQFDPIIVEAFLDREADFAACASRLADESLPYRDSQVDRDRALPAGASLFTEESFEFSAP